MKLRLWDQVIWNRGSIFPFNELSFIDEEQPRNMYTIVEKRNVFVIDRIEHSFFGEQTDRKRILAIQLTSDGDVDWPASIRLISNEELDIFRKFIPQYDDLWRLAINIPAESENAIKPFDRLFKINGTT